MNILYFKIFLSVQIEYNELEAFNGDSSSVVVEDSRFSIDKLQPGRNYSIAIKAVSNGMESVEKRFYQATSKIRHSFPSHASLIRGSLIYNVEASVCDQTFCLQKSHDTLAKSPAIAIKRAIPHRKKCAKLQRRTSTH